MNQLKRARGRVSISFAFGVKLMLVKSGSAFAETPAGGTAGAFSVAGLSVKWRASEWLLTGIM